jgi:hypothetical protein
MHIARQRISKHISAEASARNNGTRISGQRQQYAGNNGIITFAMQLAANTTMEEEMVRTYPLLGNGCFLWIRLKTI